MMDRRSEPAAQHDESPWPALPLAAWSATYATLHMWTQIVGKIQLKQSPPANHWWQVTLHLTSRGLTTTPLPYGPRTFQIDFDFVDHALVIRTSEGQVRTLPLVPQTVAAFYRSLMDALAGLGIEVKIWTMPVEIPDPIRFELDEVHAAYDAGYANTFWRILVQVDRVLNEFRCRYHRKEQPGAFLLGQLRPGSHAFLGTEGPGASGGSPLVADFVTREAYSHEVISVGFWPGGGAVPEAAFYAYAYPEPAGFKTAQIQPRQAFYSTDFGEFILRYDDVRAAERPDEALLAFAQSTYEAGARLGGWERAELERVAPGE